jgi:hypothetical protein
LNFSPGRSRTIHLAPIPSVTWENTVVIYEGLVQETSK